MLRQESKLHYKLYKAGRQWLVAGIAVAGLGVGLAQLDNQRVAAAEQPSAQAGSPATAATSTPSAGDAATAPAAAPGEGTETREAPSPEPETPASATVTPAPEAETPVAAAVTATSQQALTPSAPQTTAVTGTPSTQPAEPADAAAPADDATAVPDDQSQNLDLTGSKADVTNNFKANGDATIGGADESATVTLTPNAKRQSGNLTLNSQIDLGYDFDMTAQIDFGKADGVSIGFHTGNTDQVGRNGGSLGFAGLPGAFGWKADTYNNANGGENANDTTADGTQYFGADPKGLDQFGAFVYTGANGITIETDTAQAQGIDSSYNQLHVHYDAASYQLTVTLTRPAVAGDQWGYGRVEADTLTWTADISAYIPADQLVSFFVAGSTGDAYQTQTFTLNAFSYHAVGTAHVHYVDQDTGDILANKDIRGALNHTVTLQDTADYGQTIAALRAQGYSPVAPNAKDQLTITSDNAANVTTVYMHKSYSATVQFVDDDTQMLLDTDEIDGVTGTVAHFDDVARTTQRLLDRGYVFNGSDLPAAFTFTPADQGRTFTVHVKHAHQQTTQTVTRTITYVGAPAELLPSTVTQTGIVTIDTDLVTNQATAAPVTLAAVTTPQLPHYTPDQTVVAEVTLTAGETPVNVTVTYTADPTVTIAYIDDGSGRVLQHDVLQGRPGTTATYDVERVIDGYQAKGYFLVSNDVPEVAQMGQIPFGEADHTYQVHLIIGQIPDETETPKDPSKPGTLVKTWVGTPDPVYRDDSGHEVPDETPRDPEKPGTLVKTWVGTPDPVYRDDSGHEVPDEAETPNTLVKTWVGTPDPVYRDDSGHEVPDEAETSNTLVKTWVGTPDPAFRDDSGHEVPDEAETPNTLMKTWVGTPDPAFRDDSGHEVPDEAETPNTLVKTWVQLPAPLSVTVASLHDQGYGPDGKPLARQQTPTRLSDPQAPAATAAGTLGSHRAQAQLPQTGDETSIVGPLGLLVTAITALFAVGPKRRRED
ncbi:lectin-like domain-containing protein [Lacticaseibacillus absianus]|uniref:lectin-like domain-containing protein n=1 Tax=Lacticaseibacillus absianus TaxID=2729623 RepID=UPI0015C82F51|nr:KxYKxGKxW signal peptide domain-containing protein [Lacticaseibacillus absianus]